MKNQYRKMIYKLLVAVSIIIPAVALAHAPTDSKKITATLSPMLKKTTPAVINIAVEKVIQAKNDSGNPMLTKPPRKAMAVGSGVIIDAKKGYIVTNAHIVKDQKVMVVTLKDGRRYRAKLIGKAPGFDIAVIQIHANNLTAMAIGNSSTVNVGDYVVAVGSPFGLSQTVTSGVVSALNRSTPRIEGFQNFIQTDAPINPGNSGGALIDLKGQFIGMNTAILAPNEGNIGIGFAIPSNMVENVAKQLIKYGKITPGMLGVLVQDLTPELAEALHLKHNAKGVLITEALPGSPATDAGLESEDVITDVDHDMVTTAAQLHNLMGITHPGTEVKIDVLRNGKQKVLTAKIRSPKSKVKQRIIPYITGLRLQNFSDLEPDSTMIQGTMVLSVSDTSAGALAGLIPGDIIIQANGKDVDSVKSLINIAEHSPKQLLLKIVRGTGNLFVVVQPDQ